MGFGIPKLGGNENAKEMFNIDAKEAIEYAKKGKQIAEVILKEKRKYDMHKRVMSRVNQELSDGVEGYGQAQDEELARLEESLSERRISQEEYDEQKMYLEYKQGYSTTIDGQISGLKELLDAGELTQEQFDEAKADLEKLRKN